MVGNRRIEFWGNVPAPVKEDLEEERLKYEQQLDLVLGLVLTKDLVEVYKLHKCKVSYRDISRMIGISESEVLRRWRRALTRVKKFQSWLTTIY